VLTKTKTKTDTTIVLRRGGRATVGPARVHLTDVDLWPGEIKYVSITLSRYDLSMWDVIANRECVPKEHTLFRSERAVAISGRYTF